MKTIRNYLFLLLFVVVFTACDDNDGNDIRPDQVPGTVLTTFTQMFPDATVKEWEQYGSRYKVECYQQGKETEVWFEADGTWKRTETDYREPLPEAVQNYVTKNYAGYHVEDVDWVEVPNHAYFEIELEKGDRHEFVLLIRPDGMPMN